METDSRKHSSFNEDPELMKGIIRKYWCQRENWLRAKCEDKGRAMILFADSLCCFSPLDLFSPVFAGVRGIIRLSAVCVGTPVYGLITDDVLADKIIQMGLLVGCQFTEFDPASSDKLGSLTGGCSKI